MRLSLVTVIAVVLPLPLHRLRLDVLVHTDGYVPERHRSGGFVLVATKARRPRRRCRAACLHLADRRVWQPEMAVLEQVGPRRPRGQCTRARERAEGMEEPGGDHVGERPHRG